MTKEEAQAAADAARLADPEFFHRIAVRPARGKNGAYVCVCYATEACYYVADTVEKVENASRFMLDSVKRPS